MSHPKVLGANATVGEVRSLFADDHVHLALLTDGEHLVGAITRADVPPSIGDAEPARPVARLRGVTVGPEGSAEETRHRMIRDGTRRLAVVTSDEKLLGLLCLKRSRSGFCSDSDVLERGLGGPRR